MKWVRIAILLITMWLWGITSVFSQNIGESYPLTGVVITIVPEGLGIGPLYAKTTFTRSKKTLKTTRGGRETKTTEICVEKHPPSLISGTGIDPRYNCSTGGINSSLANLL